MRYILLLFPFVFNISLAQQKEKTVSVSCYVNAELYLQASVIAHASDKTGKTSCKGRYVTINNKSTSPFYYKSNNRWVALKPQGRVVIMPALNSNSTSAASIFVINVKYSPVKTSSISSKVSAMARMNAETDRIKARELEGASSKATVSTSKPAEQPTTVARSPATTAAKPTSSSDETIVEKKPVAEPASTQAKAAPEKKKTVAKAAPKTSARRSPPKSSSRPAQRQASSSVATNTAIGLRIDFGNGTTGLGPNIKHKLNRNLALDAALVFFDGNVKGLGAQLEQSFPVRTATGLDWYIGIGPQFLFDDENTAIALVPVTGLDYRIPKSPVNLSFDWRPNFYISPTSLVQAGRFGLSVRIAF